MSFLFLETALSNRVELLDKNFSTIEFLNLSARESSLCLHKSILSLLDKHSLKIKDLDGVISVAGPGSYTGLRLSEGFAQITKWCGIKSYSFYLHQIPRFNGVDDYLWLSKAFKGEYFFYSVAGAKINQGRFKEVKDIDFILRGSVIYVDDKDLFESIGIPNSISIMSLIEDQNKKYFKEIVESDLKMDIFYYRNDLEEFIPSLK